MLFQFKTEVLLVFFFFTSNFDLRIIIIIITIAQFTQFVQKLSNIIKYYFWKSICMFEIFLNFLSLIFKTEFL